MGADLNKRASAAETQSYNKVKR